MTRFRIRDKVERIRDHFRKFEYGKTWQDDKIIEQYDAFYSRTPLIHEDFFNFINKHRDKIKTVLEIGCGIGIYPIRNKHLFEGMAYTGVDIGKPAIDYCKSRSPFRFLLGDFIMMDLHEKSFDLIFSHAVIDHVHNIDKFMSRIVALTKKYAYISAYRGYFPDLHEHIMTKNKIDGCYYNDLSVPRLRMTLCNAGLEESQFTIRRQASGIELGQKFSIGLDGYETIVEIHR